jgi:hypothetical protein
MKAPLKHVALILGTVLSIGLVLQPAIGQDHPKTATTKSTKSRGDAKAADPNIKHDRAANDPNAKIEAPAAKGGPKSRQSACRIHIDNRTGLYIDIFTDGNYRGQISPWDDSYAYVGCGGTTFYGRATFSDGSVRTWGPAVYYVDGAFTWSLTD